ncbi:MULTISPECIES: nuclear transport factor 2 family protein [unclassified Sphingobium]|uniref:nuclear transport factor 2 family protein n=1 Tax=unclassified Sphingobium TaxID=2611147 RepID=UPI0022247DEB|nr:MULTISPECIES: nuclear transport factor 2 family protein [unclassified Sphingobium]MCW2382806.1 ketosteroid isomerase-like protein [Sphingobium sp. B2D3B]MCW2397021.1 ketosteroid isomerase-like protein [Sphingobium sp. B2D3C]
MSRLLRAALALALIAPGAASAQQGDAPDRALAQRVQVLEDREAIRRVIIAYGEYLDARDYAGYAGLFASDGTWSGGLGSATGPAAIQKLLEEKLGKPEAGFVNKRSFHLVTTEVIDVIGDTAIARSRYMFYTADGEGRPATTLAGRYVDHFVRENGAWKIKTRTSHGVIPWRDGDNPERPPLPPQLQGAVKN